MNFQERPDLIPDVQTPNNEAAQESIHATPTQPVTPSGGRHAIHCLTIIGHVEGHYVLPEQTKPPSTKQLCRKSWRWKKRNPLKDF